MVFLYMDHKNNMFKESLLENRRIAKKVSTWALELQQFDVVRVWIRGEANILADAPSRAPVDLKGVAELPVPVGPVRQLIQQLYWSPEEFGRECERRYDVLRGGSPPSLSGGGDGAVSAGGDEAVPIPRADPTLRHWVLDDDPHTTTTVPEEWSTPQFGRTPEFGSREKVMRVTVIPELRDGRFRRRSALCCRLLPRDVPSVPGGSDGRPAS